MGKRDLQKNLKKERRKVKSDHTFVLFPHDPAFSILKRVRRDALRGARLPRDVHQIRIASFIHLLSFIEPFIHPSEHPSVRHENDELPWLTQGESGSFTSNKFQRQHNHRNVILIVPAMQGIRSTRQQTQPATTANQSRTISFGYTRDPQQSPLICRPATVAPMPTCFSILVPMLPQFSLEMGRVPRGYPNFPSGAQQARCSDSLPSTQTSL